MGKGMSEEKAREEAGKVRVQWYRTALYGKHNASAEERGALRAVLDDSAWTEARCCAAGYVEFPTCNWCQQGIGNRKHRLYGCPRLEEIDGCRLKEGLRIRGKSALDDSPFWAGLIPVGQARPCQGEGYFRWIGEQIIFTGEVFGDGSSMGPDGFKRGGSAFGVLKVSEEESITNMGDSALEGGWSTLEGEDQSSAEAELDALRQVVSRACPPLHYVTDSMLVVRGVARGKAWTTRASEIQADWWLKIWKEVEQWPEHAFRASHVKAHRRKEVLQSLSEEQRRWWHGNRLADIWAGRAARANQVSAGFRARELEDRKDYMALACWAGKVMKECAEQKPWAREGRRWRVINEIGSDEYWRLPRHEVTTSKGVWKCKRCPKVATTAYSKKRFKATACFGSVIHRASAFGRTKGGQFMKDGHLLNVAYPMGAGSKVGIVWCARCGSYGEKAARGLLRKCRGWASRAGQRVIKKFRSDKHPVDGRVLKKSSQYFPKDHWTGGIEQEAQLGSEEPAELSLVRTAGLSDELRAQVVVVTLGEEGGGEAVEAVPEPPSESATTSKDLRVHEQAVSRQQHRLLSEEAQRREEAGIRAEVAGGRKEGRAQGRMDTAWPIEEDEAGLEDTGLEEAFPEPPNEDEVRGLLAQSGQAGPATELQQRKGNRSSKRSRFVF